MDNIKSLSDIWKSVLAICKNEVSDVVFKTWIAPLEFYKLDEDTAVFIIDAEFKKNIILKKFSGMLKKCFEEVIGFEVEIDIVVNEAFNEKHGEENEVSQASSQKSEEANNSGEQDEDNTENNKSGKKKSISSYTFDNYVVGKSNLFAYNVAKGVAENPGSNHNPFLIYGNSGLGKTHLLFAIYNELKRKNPNSVVIYTTAESFLNELVDCVSKKNTAFFHNKYRNVDALLMDDIQIIQNGEMIQEEFFHTFNALDNAGKQLVLTADVQPKEMSVLDDRLRTRLLNGVIADIQPPDIETRKAIIKRKSDSLGIVLSDAATEYIASNIKTNIRQLEGTVNKIEALKKVYGVMPSLEQIQGIVKDISYDSVPVSILVDKILKAVSDTYGVSVEDIKSSSRQKNIAYARNVSMFVMKKLAPNMTLNEIGAYFNKNHATVINSLNNVTAAIDSDSIAKNTVNGIIRDVKEKY